MIKKITEKYIYHFIGIEKNNSNKDFYNNKRNLIFYVHKLIKNIFNLLGFIHVDNFDISSVYNNFLSLGISKAHPSIKYTDTFYINKSNLFLRTHTSSCQYAYMKNNYPPFKVLMSGKVYRIDYDKTHMPLFHQVEGLVINKNININNLFFCINYFIELFFDERFSHYQFRSSYFPFTCPSFELDLKIEKWIEVLGCGMVNADLLSNCNINKYIYNGFAFGMGVERLTMLKFDIPDIKFLYK